MHRHQSTHRDYLQTEYRRSIRDSVIVTTFEIFQLLLLCIIYTKTETARLSNKLAALTVVFLQLSDVYFFFPHQSKL